MAIKRKTGVEERPLERWVTLREPVPVRRVGGFIARRKSDANRGGRKKNERGDGRVKKVEDKESGFVGVKATGI